MLADQNTINWADITGLCNDCWTIVGKTNTINWAGCYGNKAETDLMNWTNVTDAQTMSRRSEPDQ